MGVIPARFKQLGSKWRNYFRAFGRAHRKARPELGSSMPLLQHLNELRVRVFRALGAVALTTILSFIYAEQLIDILAAPIGGSEQLVSIEVTENIAIFMRVALLSGLVLGMPAIVYQMRGLLLPTARGLRRILLRWAERTSCRTADWVLCQSPSLRRLAPVVSQSSVPINRNGPDRWRGGVQRVTTAWSRTGSGT